eukprot:2645056-Amphidinium_carterae.1
MAQYPPVTTTAHFVGCEQFHFRTVWAENDAKGGSLLEQTAESQCFHLLSIKDFAHACPATIMFGMFAPP